MSAASLILAAAVLLPATGCGRSSSAAQVRLIYAGSVIVPIDDLAARYRQLHPDVQVLTESHGSIQCIRQITELHREFDILVTADYSLIPPMMYDTTDAASGHPYADWYVEFATNKVVLAYGPHSRHADELDADNWHEVLTRPDVRWGLADPRIDAAGYRALMVLQLAEGHYKDKVLFEDMTLGRFQQPLVTEEEGGRQVVRVPELVQTIPGAGVVMRGSSIQLLPLLASGDIDYAFEYESVVRQHGLKYLELPPQIDLSADDCSSLYQRVVVKIDAQRFASVKPEFRGEVIGYAYTIPSNAPNRAEAVRFLAWLQGPEARKILAADHQPLIEPPRVDGWENLPPALTRALQASGAAGGP